MLANPEFYGTNKELYETVGISHDTFYKWIKDEAVLSYAEKLIEKYTDADLGTVWKALILKCRTGDTQAIKLYFELKGKYKQNIQMSGSGVIQIIDDIPEAGGERDQTD